MNPLREAALAIHAAEQAHRGLMIHLDVGHKLVHLTADMGDRSIGRHIRWEEIEAPQPINILTATVALLVNKILSEEE